METEREKTQSLASVQMCEQMKYGMCSTSAEYKGQEQVEAGTVSLPLGIWAKRGVRVLNTRTEN